MELEELEALMLLGAVQSSSSQLPDYDITTLNTLPMLILTEFTISDPSRDDEARTLFELDGDETRARRPTPRNGSLEFVARGTLKPVFDVEEEDDALSDLDGLEAGKRYHKDGIRARLGAIWHTSVGPDSPYVLFALSTVKYTDDQLSLIETYGYGLNTRGTS